VINLLVEPFQTCGDTKDALEVFLIIETGFHSWINVVFARIYMKKIAINVSSAIDDWASSSTEKQSYLIMTGYARIGRVITISQLMIGFLAAVVYFPSVIIGNQRQVFICNTNCYFNYIIYFNYILFLIILYTLIIYYH